MGTQTTSYCANFDKPDEVRAFKGHGHVDVVNFSDGTAVGKAVFEPGWRWSQDVKPIAGTETCQASHTGQCLAGTMVIHMDGGDEFTVRPGDVFHIPPGHDAWVDGKEACVMIDVTAAREYAKPQPRAR